MSVSFVTTCSKTTGVLCFQLPYETVLTRTMQFCREEFIVESYDVDEFQNILLFMLDRETIVKVNVVSCNVSENLQTEVSVVCLCGEVDSMSLFAEFFFLICTIILLISLECNV